ncbi:MAG: deoxyribonuclease IV [Patescibacteria group bacterium]
MAHDTPKIGAHVSTQGGLANAFENAKKIGAEAIQFFGSSPQQWAVREPKPEDIEKFKTAHKKAGDMPVFLHAAYLVNLASPNEITRANSIQSLIGHLEICEAIGAEGLIFHIGSAVSSKALATEEQRAVKEQAIEFLVSGVKKVLEKVKGNSLIILENSSAGGAKLGATSEEIGLILNKIKSKRAKVCFDTAHALEAGVIKYEQVKEIKNTFDEWDKEIGLENIIAIHANDSKTPFASHNDRHENIGEGCINLAGFKNLAKEYRLKDKVWLLEVPGFDNLGPDKKNIDILKSCFG